MEAVRDTRAGKRDVSTFHLRDRPSDDDGILPALLNTSIKLKAIHRFESTAAAVEDISAMQEGKLSKGLKDFLTDEVVKKGKGKEKLAVVDKTLGRTPSLLYVRR